VERRKCCHCRSCGDHWYDGFCPRS